MPRSNNKSMEEAVYKLVQKVDDLKDTVTHYMQKEAPILARVPIHEERISWMKKAILSIYGIIGALVASAAASVFSSK